LLIKMKRLQKEYEIQAKLLYEDKKKGE